MAFLTERSWGIVLAGGEGQRMKPIIQRWLGYPRPKQYCTFVGHRSMLQHTLDRAAQLVEPTRIVTVIGRGHEQFLPGALKSDFPGRMIVQPRNFDTAPGVFLPLTHVMAADPEATLLILPSDHFVFPEGPFLQHLETVLDQAERFPERLILVGVQPDQPTHDYGWIEPCLKDPQETPLQDPTLLKIEAFREKPSPQEAAEFFRRGFLWNTMIMGAKAKTLWKLGSRCFPEMLNRFELLRLILQGIREGTLDKSYEQRALNWIYSDLPAANFSRDFLQRSTDTLLVSVLDSIQWSDWGRPNRIEGSLERLGKKSFFSSHSPATLSQASCLRERLLDTL